jgi:hypothetical protein
MVLLGRTWPINPRSPRHEACCWRWRLIADAWRHTLTPTQRAGWQAWAAAVSWPNKRLGPRVVPGINGFFSVNMIRLICSLALRAAPPASAGLAVVTQPTWARADPMISATISLADPWVSQDGACGTLSLDAPRGVTQAARGTSGLQLGYMLGSSTSPPPATSTYTSPWPLTATCQPWGTLRVVDGAGRPSVL